MPLFPDGALGKCGIGGATAVLVGLSGGADSVALLHALNMLARSGDVGRIVAAHLHHGIRGEAADRDQMFCRALCQRLQVPLTEAREDVPAFAAEKGLSLEQAARECRYAFLNRAADEAGADVIAVAHHMDDQAETVLLHLARGCGLAGLCGMQYRTGRLVRPLLFVRRRQIEAYLAEHGERYCTDETNFQLYAARNRVRHSVLPALSEVNSECLRHIAEMAERVSADERYLSECADLLLAEAAHGAGYGRKLLSAAPGPILTRALLRLAGRERTDVSAADVRRLTALLAARTGTCIELSGGMSAWVSAKDVFVGHLPQNPSFRMPFRTDGVTQTPLGRFVAQRVASFRMPERPTEAYIDLAALPEGTEARSRMDGDVFFPLGAPGKRLLSDCLTDRKVPRGERGLPILACGREVLFVPGYTVSERIRVHADSLDILHIVYIEGE